MSLSFSDRPGPRERQLRRRHGNPLFGSAAAVDPEQLRRAKLADQAEAREFEQAFPALMERAANLPPTAESDQVLVLKEDLDKAYEQAAGLAGDQARLMEAINKLIGVIMRAVWKGAGNDSAAQEELRQEEEARRLHQALLQQPLIADLLNPDTPIPPEELAATLLSETEPALAAALVLFDPSQVEALHTQASALVAGLDAAVPIREEANRRLHQMEAALAPPALH
jgi:hypothetical protein